MSERQRVVSDPISVGRRQLLAGLAVVPALALTRPARAAESVKFLLPAPSTLIAFAPQQIARQRGYFRERGLDVEFAVGRGGADVAKQVALGNADVGTCLGEVAIVVRANGLPIKDVALLGGHPFYQIALRASLGAKSLQDLRGRRVGVVSYEDSSYYALLGVMAALQIPRSEIKIEAVGNGGIRQLMIAGNLDAATVAPEATVEIEQAGTHLDTFAIEGLFPGMAQAVVASDATIASRPAMLAGVAACMVRSVREIVADPEAAARDFVAAVPQQKERQAEIGGIMRDYARLVYSAGDGVSLGRIDPKHLQTIQDMLYASQIIRSTSPIEELYTNRFVS